MDINQLRYVIEIDKAKSLRKASQNLFISQPTLNKAINDLESEFNITIFNKTNRGVNLTSDGKEFLESAKYILNQINNFEKFHRNPSDEKMFKLRVSSDIVFSLGEVIGTVFNSINENFIRFSVKESFKEQVILEVAERYSEIGFLSICSIDEKVWRSLIDVNNLEFYEIKKEKLYVYVGKNNPLYNNIEIHPLELKDLTRIHLVGKTNLAISYRLSQDIIDLLTEDQILSLNDKETISKVIENTNTYTFASECKNNSYRENIRCIPLANSDNIYTSIGWIKHKNDELTNEAKIFLKEFLKSLE